MSENAAVKVAIVTGATSGIGKSAALRIAERGARVIITYHRYPDRANEVVAEIEQRGGSAIALPLDVGRSETFAGFVERAQYEIEQRWNRTTFDYLVNNAGFGQPAMFEETSEELFDHFHRVLLKGPYFLTQKLLPLLANGGAIVNTSSSSATTSISTGYSAYATMKGGLMVLTRYMAKELAVRRIRVNCVAPGPTRTQIGDGAFDRMPEVIAPLVAQTALGRIGEGDDVGKVIAALLSDDFAWVTGQNIETSGGYCL